jgi:RNA polymerase sigma-70 factor (sigma-E family)
VLVIAGLSGLRGDPADQSVGFDALYKEQWWPMLRLAQGLVDDLAAAEDVVQDAFAAMYRRQADLREPQAAIGYLRISVVNAARSALRRRRTARAHLPALHALHEGHEQSADHAALVSDEHRAVRAALAELPDRQREVLTLRYLADLSDPEIAEATGLSPGGVRSAASRGLAVLRGSLGGQQ